jgi:hypothetical protein
MKTMNRTQEQVEKQVARAEFANKLIDWLEKSKITEGCLIYPIISDFIKDLNRLPWESLSRLHIEAWKAWDMLRDAGRVVSRPGHWELLESTHIEIDRKGNIVPLC